MVLVKVEQRDQNLAEGVSVLAFEMEEQGEVSLSLDLWNFCSTL